MLLNRTQVTFKHNDSLVHLITFSSKMLGYVLVLYIEYFNYLETYKPAFDYLKECFDHVKTRENIKLFLQKSS